MNEPSAGSRFPDFVLPFDSEQKQGEAFFLQEQQIAEQALFRFVVALACQEHASLDVVQGLSRYLGQAYPLPAAQIIAATAQGPVPGALENLNAALVDTPLDLAEPEIEEQSPTDKALGNNRWISIYTPEVSIEDSLQSLNKKIWGQTVDPLLTYAVPKARAKPSERKMRLASLLGLAAFTILTLAAAQNYGCAPDLSFLEMRAAKKEPKKTPPLVLDVPSPRYPANKQPVPPPSGLPDNPSWTPAGTPPDSPADSLPPAAPAETVDAVP